MSLQAWGNVSRLFWTWHFYHNVVHLLFTMSSAALLYFLLVPAPRPRPVLADARSRQKGGIAVLAFALGSTVNARVRGVRLVRRHVLRAHLLENYSHDIHELLFGGWGASPPGLARRLGDPRLADPWADADETSEPFRAQLDARVERGS